ncbi:hypothetical protein KWE68_03295 [Acinetobacter baumannii]
MEKFEEYFRTTKHYENMLLDIARNQLSVSVFDKNGRKYRNHIVQTAYEVFQHQQAKVEELQTLYTQQGINMLKLQKRVDVALKLIESWNEIAFDKTTHWTEGYEEGCYHCAAQLEQALKGEGQ